MATTRSASGDTFTELDLAQEKKSLSDYLEEDVWEELENLPPEFLHTDIEPIQDYLTTLDLASAGEAREIDVGELLDLHYVGPKRVQQFLETVRAIKETCSPLTDDEKQFNHFYRWATIHLSDRQQEVLERRLGIGRTPESMESIAESYDVSRQRIDQIEKKVLDRVDNELTRELFNRYLKRDLERVVERILREEKVVDQEELRSSLSDWFPGETWPFYRQLFVSDEFFDELGLQENGFVFNTESVRDDFLDLREWLVDTLETGDRYLEENILTEKIQAASLDDVPNVLEKLVDFTDRVYRHQDWIFLATNRENFEASESRVVREALLLLGEPAHLDAITEKVNELSGLDLSVMAIKSRVRYFDDIFTRIGTVESIYGLVEWGWEPERNVRETMTRVLSEASDTLKSREIFERVQERWPDVTLNTVRQYLNRADRFVQVVPRRWGLKE